MPSSELDYTGKRVLVTGGAGFIGSNLCEALLERGAQVVCMDNLLTGKRENIESYLGNQAFSFLEKSITDFDACLEATSGIDLVFHQAALGSVPRSIENPLRTNQHNITGFLNILEAARENGCKRFVYAASSSTYGDHEELPKVEENIGKPLSPYAVTKYCNELYARVFYDLYGMETIGLRYFNVFGRNQDPDGAYAAVIPKFIQKMILGERPTINGNGEQSRDFTFVENVVEVNIQAGLSSNNEAFGEVFNIAFGQRTTLLELYQVLQEKIARYKPEVKKIEPIFGPVRHGDVKHSQASIEKARDILNYSPKFSPEEGLDRAITWYWESISKNIELT